MTSIDLLGRVGQAAAVDQAVADLGAKVEDRVVKAGDQAEAEQVVKAGDQAAADPEVKAGDQAVADRLAAE